MIVPPFWNYDFKEGPGGAELKMCGWHVRRFSVSIVAHPQRCNLLTGRWERQRRVVGSPEKSLTNQRDVRNFTNKLILDIWRLICDLWYLLLCTSVIDWYLSTMVHPLQTLEPLRSAIIHTLIDSDSPRYTGSWEWDMTADRPSPESDHLSMFES